MKKAITIALVLLLALSLLTACDGKKETSGVSVSSSDSSGGADVAAAKSGYNDNLFDISKSEIMVSSNLNKESVLAEIPAEIFKGVGTLNSGEVWADTIGSFKYTVVLHFNVKSKENAVKALMDYYTSVGAKVEETGNKYNPYSVAFPWGESVEVKFGDSVGQDYDYVNLQFGVVKK